MTPFLRRALPWALLVVVYIVLGVAVARLDLPAWVDWGRYAVAGLVVGWMLNRKTSEGEGP